MPSHQRAPVAGAPPLPWAQRRRRRPARPAGGRRGGGAWPPSCGVGWMLLSSSAGSPAARAANTTPASGPFSSLRRKLGSAALLALSKSRTGQCSQQTRCCTVTAPKQKHGGSAHALRPTPTARQPAAGAAWGWCCSACNAYGPLGVLGAQPRNIGCTGLGYKT